MRISDWSSDVCSSDLAEVALGIGIARCNRPLVQAPTLCRIALQPIAALEIGGAQGLSCMQIAGLDSARKPDAPPHRIAWDAPAAQVDQIGRATGRDRVWQYERISEDGDDFKKTEKKSK